MTQPSTIRDNVRAAICLPTYDERENLEPMIRALGSVLDLERDFVLVIDDVSPDGTGEIADQLAQKLDWVEVLHRPRKQGIGPAYVAGFRHALERGATFVVEMDCDFSHDPAVVAQLIASCEENADLALGSRYIRGGGTVNWSLTRRFVSRAGSFYARTILGVPVRDLTGGFKCFRRSVLEAIDLGSITAEGYGFQIEGTYRVWRKGFHIVELPITFTDRRVGASKMSTAIVVEAMLQVPMLRARALVGRL